MTSRAVVFTLNNPEVYMEDMVIPPYVRYLVWQYEIGDSGTYHWQGYAAFVNAQRFSALKKWMPATHFENRLD